MARKSDIPGRVVEAALNLAARQGWRRTSISAIAAEAGLDLAQVHAAFPSKSSIVRGFVKRVDEQVLAETATPGSIKKTGEEAGESARDRLFDVLMRRFDALTPHKAGLAAIIGNICADPLAAVVLLPRFMCSMAWMLEAAGLSSSGPCGAFRVKGLALVYGEAFRAWLGDDSEDMAKTMAALDRALRRAERVVNLCLPRVREAASG
ncbi:MAG: helix-turn-helix domain-containing protein [Rhodospirillales bacterium]|jgi:AcrR family transcriptional regulator|nr:helix-turn-helix domain-containing protein [Rhodospirillales bacterium]